MSEVIYAKNFKAAYAVPSVERAAKVLICRSRIRGELSDPAPNKIVFGKACQTQRGRVDTLDQCIGSYDHDRVGESVKHALIKARHRGVQDLVAAAAGNYSGKRRFILS